MKKVAIIILGLTVVGIILTWSPWLDNERIHDKVLGEKGRIDKTVDEKGNLVCDYNVRVAPFGRWAASCEGGYYVTFWGEIY